VLTALLSLAAVVVATPANIERLYGIEPAAIAYKCGSQLTPEVLSKREADFTSRLAKREAEFPSLLAKRGEDSTSPPAKDGNKGDTGGNGTFTVPVYFHVIYASENASEGYIPDSQVQSQIDVLNEDYKKTGLNFKLQEITRTLNADWFNGAGPYQPGYPLQLALQTAMKTALRQGGASTLNIYTVGFKAIVPQGLLGYTTSPAVYASDPTDDGVVLHYGTLPGGFVPNHNLGVTGTHEVGHWLGLLHPFEGGCNGSGDYVHDTPAEAASAFGCPAGRDTCPGAGLDAIHNYMDYTDDTCRNNFTPGQIARIHSQLSIYRGVNI